jgi:hypothetical protein
MARFLRGFILTNFSGSTLKNLAGSIFKKILTVAVCLLISALVPVRALAQHPSVPTRGGGRPAAPAPILRPPLFGGARGASPPVVGPHGVGPHLVRMGPRGFPFRQRPIRVVPHGVFFGRPFFRFGVGLRFNSLWWPTCAPLLGWGAGFGCYSAPSDGYGFDNYVAQQPHLGTDYPYVGGERDLIWLYLKDGTGYGVIDYWLVNGQMHFSLVEDDPTKPSRARSSIRRSGYTEDDLREYAAWISDCLSRPALAAVFERSPGLNAVRRAASADKVTRSAHRFQQIAKSRRVGTPTGSSVRRFAECVCPTARLVGREGNAMKNAIYQWQAAYRSAVFETDPKQLSIHINDARRAIDERLHRPLLIDSPEHRALEDARRGFAELEAERVKRDDPAASA